MHCLQDVGNANSLNSYFDELLFSHPVPLPKTPLPSRSTDGAAAGAAPLPWQLLNVQSIAVRLSDVPLSEPESNPRDTDGPVRIW